MQLAELQKAPEELLYLWQWWRDIYTGERLTFVEIQAFSTLMGLKITPGEVAVIRRLDMIYWGQKNG